MLIVLVGGTAVGKDTIKKELIDLGLSAITTYTTRPPRNGEVNGVTYHFITKDKFKRMESNNEFLETTSYNVATGDTWYYGTPLADMGDDKVIILNPSGLKVLKSKGIPCLVIRIVASEGVIRNRLLLRGDKMNEINRRIIADNKDFIGVDEYVDIKIQNEGEMTPEIIARVIYNTYNYLKGEK